MKLCSGLLHRHHHVSLCNVFSLKLVLRDPETPEYDSTEDASLPVDKSTDRTIKLVTLPAIMCTSFKSNKLYQ
jgi:hypothetical protein